MDEPVDDGAASAAFLDRFDTARAVVAERGIHLVNWISYDDDRFRAARLHTMVLAEQPEWWNVPPVG